MADAMKKNEIDIQQQYYMETASRYDGLHLDPKDEHYFALTFLVGAIEYLDIRSILDVGSGTGRALVYIKQIYPDIRVVGIEPVKELREIGYQKGLSKSELVAGDATKMTFSDGEFDLVCEFGVLHHVRDHRATVAAMLRVAKKAIFISDTNNFGRGSRRMRLLKQIINAFGLWQVADYINTRGKGYNISEGDGLAYSYSVFSDYKLIRKHCQSVHILNTRDMEEPSPYRSASHVALLGIKKE